MQQEDNPLVSVLMGVYYQRDCTDLLDRSVRSILEQSYSRLEFLICDDGSSKDAKDLLDAYAKKDKRIVLIRPGDKITLAEKLNVCLQCAQGKLIARMDDDDRSHPERLEKQMEWLKQYPKIAFVGSNASLYQGKELVSTRKFPEYPGVRDFLFRQPFLHPALMFRQESLQAINGYSEDRCCILCEDYDLLLRLYEEGYRGANIQENLLDYSLPEKGKRSRKMVHRWNEATVRYRHFKKLRLLPEACPYVIKPLIAGLLPPCVLEQLKKLFAR